MIEQLTNFLKENGYCFRKNYEIKYETYFKTGGIVKIFCAPLRVNDLKEIITYAYKNSIDYKIIGHTSNVIFLDQLEYSFIISCKNLMHFEVNNKYVNIESGYSLQDFVRVVSILKKSEGYEGLEGIPGSIGGAIYMNAGAYGHNISDNLISVDCIDRSGNLFTLTKEECNFNYRDSVFKKEDKYIIVGAKFKLKLGNINKIAENIEKYHIARHSYQEFVYPNVGSLFSMKSDIYYSIIDQRNRKHVLISKIYRILYKNRITKFIKRKRPEQIIFNKMISRYYGNFIITPSIKNLNVLINSGSDSMDKIIEHIIDLKKRINEDARVENEIIIEPIYSKKDISDELIKKISELNSKKNQ